MLPALLVLAAIALPSVIYLALAVRENRRGITLTSFFPLTRFIPGHEYGRSTAAAGVSLATVILALVNLAPIMGIGLLITIASYVAGFLALYWVAPAILRANAENRTLQSYLGHSYRSRAVKHWALAFSFIGYVSIFSMELIVGVTVLEPLFPNSTLLAATLFMLFIVTYSAIGGFRAIVATEQWQIRFVLVAVGALAVVACLIWSELRPIPLPDLFGDVFGSWNAGWAFCLGIVAMNVPAAISDAGTWQRLCATRSEGDARQGLRRAMLMFSLIWGSLIVASCFIAVTAQAAGIFDATAQPLMTFIINYLAGGGVIGLVLLFAFALGLFAALITTADSLLLVATQMLTLDMVDSSERTPASSENLTRARMMLAIVALTSFAFFVGFRALGLDVVQLVFSVYGAQLALFPATAAALLASSGRITSVGAPAAILSIAGGFLAAWGAALYGRFGGDPTWLYNAPVAALATSAILLLALAPFTRSRPVDTSS
jgi:Na+/proline symporter